LPILETRTLDWPDESACAASAQALARRPEIRDATLELAGELGAGKTTFARHLLRALGVAGRIKSPSYAVVEPYALASGTNAWHFDFYRFDDPREWEDAGLREPYAARGLKLAEWPEKAGAALPEPDLHIAIEVQGRAQRRATLSAHSAAGRGRQGPA
jgi:tRNA threonylcarbamoyladenosine biosynthesis protein TsaE